MLDSIKTALGEELSEQVEAKLADAKIELAIMNNGSVVHADKYDTLKAEHKSLQSKYETEVSDFTKKLEAATKDVTDIEALKSSIETLKVENQNAVEKFNQDRLNIKMDSMIDVALLKANANEKYVPLLKTQINRENLKFEGDNLIGLTDVVGKLQADFPESFGEIKKMGTPPNADQKNAPIGEKAKLIKQYEGAGTLAEKLALQRKIKKLKE